MKFVQLRSLRDLIMLVASSQSSGVIQHLANGNSHLYFLVGGTLHEMFLYCVKEKEQIKGNFITYNSYSGEIGSSEKMQHEPNQSSFPVVEIVNQDLLPTDLLSRLDEL
ncbi:MAG: hypothetical protein NTV61_07010 [Candidatus Bathyarchaeota archaeon]|nr:hypothetical protein [Candidatus Bathyarchaeota archaeon]